MQTFLPYANFTDSAITLDKKRCWKQVVEAHQIIDVLEGKTKSWENHPAILMWGRDYLIPLKHYFNCFLYISKRVHKVNTKYEPYNHVQKYMDLGGSLLMPWWLGNEDFHCAMRARLIEKDRDFYLPLFPDDEGFNGGKYFWPDMKTETFRII